YGSLHWRCMAWLLLFFFGIRSPLRICLHCASVWEWECGCGIVNIEPAQMRESDCGRVMTALNLQEHPGVN
ncbi:hypothetical protein B0T09DRAFT_347372, partial [Sordaria sp. MPI-SDFR-AT-0083]